MIYIEHAENNQIQ